MSSDASSDAMLVAAVFLPDWGRLFAIHLPSVKQGWKYDADCSSSRFHFWSKQGVVFACRTFTCLSAPFAQDLCFSCKHRGSRRKSCQTHMVLNYLYSDNEDSHIESFLIGEMRIGEADVKCYQSLFPTPTRSAVKRLDSYDDENCNADLELVLRMENMWERVENRLKSDSHTIVQSLCCFAVQQFVHFAANPNEYVYNALTWQLRHSKLRKIELPLLDSPFYNTRVLYDASRMESWLQLYTTFHDAEIKWVRYSWSKDCSFDDECMWPCLFNLTSGLNTNQFKDTLILLTIVMEPYTQIYGDHVLVRDKTLVLPFLQM